MLRRAVGVVPGNVRLLDAVVLTAAVRPWRGRERERENERKCRRERKRKREREREREGKTRDIEISKLRSVVARKDLKQSYFQRLQGSSTNLVMQPGDRYCDLCISEKMFLTKAQSDPNCINKRNDVGTRCCHIKNTKLGAVT